MFDDSGRFSFAENCYFIYLFVTNRESSKLSASYDARKIKCYIRGVTFRRRRRCRQAPWSPRAVLFLPSHFHTRTLHKIRTPDFSFGLPPCFFPSFFSSCIIFHFFHVSLLLSPFIPRMQHWRFNLVCVQRIRRRLPIFYFWICSVHAMFIRSCTEYTSMYSNCAYSFKDQEFFNYFSS